MDGLTGLSLILNFAAGLFLVIVLSSPENRRRAGAWLFASAQSQVEIRRAKHAIRTEQHIRQMDLEGSFTRVLSIDRQPVEQEEQVSPSKHKTKP